MKCYFLYECSENCIQHLNITTTTDGRKTDWTVYIIKTNKLSLWVNELRSKLAKFFVQQFDDKDYNDNNLYKSLLNNCPLSWIQFILQNELEILQLSQDLSLIEEENKILPQVTDVFRIFHLLKPKQIKVIIIGQDPYPQPNIADGIAFSTYKHNPVPASLKNIFTELKDFENIDVDAKNPDLTRWVQQGCFLINSAWTVGEGKIGSHSNLWKRFVENLIRYILEVAEEKIVIAFFGSEAKTKYKNITKTHTNIVTLEVQHPSPNSSEKGFFNSQIFNKINENLKVPINWV